MDGEQHTGSKENTLEKLNTFYLKDRMKNMPALQSKRCPYYLILFTLVLTSSAEETDMGIIPCKRRILSQHYADTEAPPNIADWLFTGGLGDKVCVIEPGSSPSNCEFPTGIGPYFTSFCGKIGYVDSDGVVKREKVPIIGGLNERGQCPSPADLMMRRPDEGSPWPEAYTPEKEYKILASSAILGGVARTLYASAGEIIASTSTGTTGGKSGLCFHANEITTSETSFTWKAPKR
jgi:hypothetical protein